VEKPCSVDRPTRDVVKDIFSSDPSLQISGLQFIISHPQPAFEKALIRLEPELQNPRVISSYVKALARVRGRDALPVLAKILRHENARVRANCIEALEILEVDPSQKDILDILMNFLGDDPRVAGNCIRILAQALKPDALKSLVEDYFDRDDPRKCLNILYLIDHLKLDNSFHLVETCLNHASQQVRERATKLLKLSKAGDVEQMQLRTQAPPKSHQEPDSGNPQVKTVSDEREQEFINQLKEKVRNADHQGTLQILREISRTSFGGPLPDFLRSLLQSKSLGLDPFVLATAVKSLAQISTQNEWETLEPYLSHNNPRVASNTVEALVILKDQRVLEHLRSVAKEANFEDPATVRLLCSGMEMIKARDTSLALEIMQRFSQGDLNSVSSFVLELNRWDNPPKELQFQVLDLLQSEIRQEIVKACVSYLEIHGDAQCLDRLLILTQKMHDGQKKKRLSDLAYFLMENLGIKPLHLNQSTTEPITEIDEVASDLKDKVLQSLEKAPTTSTKSRLSKPSIGIATACGLILCISIFWILPSSASNSTKRTQYSAPSNSPFTLKNKRVLKGKGLIQELDPAHGLVRVSSENAQYEVEVQDSEVLKRLDKGQRVKFVGSFLEKDPNDVLRIKGRFIFQDEPLSKTKDSK